MFLKKLDFKDADINHNVKIYSYLGNFFDVE